MGASWGTGVILSKSVGCLLRALTKRVRFLWLILFLITRSLHKLKCIFNVCKSTNKSNVIQICWLDNLEYACFHIAESWTLTICVCDQLNFVGFFFSDGCSTCNLLCTLTYYDNTLYTYMLKYLWLTYLL